MNNIWKWEVKKLQHAYNTGLKNRGEKFYNSKLTEENVCEILSKGKYTSYQKIADKYGVSKATIRDILLGKVGSIYRDNNTIQYN